MIDYPRAWEIAKSVAFEHHHNKCSFNTTRGAILCDCDIINRHPEYLDTDNSYGSGGVIKTIAAAQEVGK